MYNRYQGNSGQVERMPDAPHAEFRPRPSMPPAAKQKPPPGTTGGGLQQLLQKFVVVVDGYGQILLCIVLTDDVFVEIFFYLCRLRHVVERHVERARVLTCSLRSEAGFEHYLVGLLRTRVADEAVHSGYEEVYVLLASSAEATYFLWHFRFSLLFYFLRIITWSIIPYSFASSAVIQ